MNKCPHPHRVQIVNVQTWETKLPPHIEDIGTCAEGCCDKYRCKECGESFLVECPD